MFVPTRIITFVIVGLFFCPIPQIFSQTIPLDLEQLLHDVCEVVATEISLTDVEYTKQENIYRCKGWRAGELSWISLIFQYYEATDQAGNAWDTYINYDDTENEIWDGRKGKIKEDVFADSVKYTCYFLNVLYIISTEVTRRLLGDQNDEDR